MHKYQQVALEATDPKPLPSKYAFLGGTVNGSNWRDLLIPMLTVGFFNPVVDNWTEEDAIRENQAKANAPVNLFVITPKQHGLYVMVELGVAACEARNNPNAKVVLAFLNEDGGEVFTDHQMASNVQIRDLLLKNPEIEILESLEDVAVFLNKYLAEDAS